MSPGSGHDETKSVGRHPSDPDPAGVARAAASRADHPREIGPYRILETLGEGGMGIVYLAEQTKPIHRRVALKIIKLGMDTKQVIARFETEREALALMNHPNVAKVFDAGVSERGRPYFVMEYVAGITITEYCDKHRLNTEERLRLFMDVCHAVQHAHQKGIIHRDIKPSNVLVSVDQTTPPLDKGGLVGVQVKVIDFGVAKATQHRLSEHTLYTEQGQLIGTPGYMSPEQAEMTALDIDTRTDVYSLGVLLYELLVGALPFDTKTLLQAGFAEIQRIIREVDPPKPSTKLSSLGDASTAIAHRRHTELRALARQLRGDLDWIVMRAIEKDRTRRYDTANALALEFERYLNHEPVLAGPPSAAYKLKKFVRRNRAPVVVGSVFIVLLVVFAVSMTVMFRQQKFLREQAEWQTTIAQQERKRAVTAEKLAMQRANEATEARDEAQKEATKSRTVLDFFQYMLSGTDPTYAKGRDVTVREVLALASSNIRTQFGGQPLTEAAVREAIAKTYRNLALFAPEIPHRRAVFDIRRKELGPHHRETLAAMSELAEAYYQDGQRTIALELHKQAWDSVRQGLGEDDPVTIDTMVRLGNTLRSLGQLGEAEPLLEKALETVRRRQGQSDLDTAFAMNNLGRLYQNQGRLHDAEQLYAQGLDVLRREFGDESPQTISLVLSLSEVRLAQGKWDEAEQLSRQAAETARRVLGEQHIHTRWATELHASALEKLGRLSEAEEVALQLLDVERRHLGEFAEAVCGSLMYLGHLAWSQGSHERARTYANELSRLGAMALESPEVGVLALNGCAVTLLTFEPATLRDAPTALRLAQKAVETDGAKTSAFLDTLALAYRQTGDVDSAVETQKLGVSLMAKADAQGLRQVGDQLLESLHEKGDIEEEERTIRNLVSELQESIGPDHPDTLSAQVSLSIVLSRNAKYSEAIEYSRETMERTRRVYGPTDPVFAIAVGNLGAFLLETGALEEAEAKLRESVSIYRASGGDKSVGTANYRSHLGECLAKMGRYIEAESELLEAYRELEQAVGREHKRTTKAVGRLVALYESWDAAEPGQGCAQKAAEWRTKLDDVRAAQPRSGAAREENEDSGKP